MPSKAAISSSPRGLKSTTRRAILDESAEETLARLLEATGHGDELALDQLMELVYKELRALAAHHLKKERPGHTLQPTALVHEAYVRLIEQHSVDWQGRAHFFRVAAQQIRRVLVDHARGRNRLKRDGKLMRVTLGEEMAMPAPDVDLLGLDAALDKLDANSPEDRQIVELKFFGGLTEEEIAEVTGMSDRTVRRRWNFARAWLYRELDRERSD